MNVFVKQNSAPPPSLSLSLSLPLSLYLANSEYATKRRSRHKSTGALLKRV